MPSSQPSATGFSRLPGTMAPLAFTALTTATTGSYRTGAVMMVAFVIGQLAVSIPVGRLLDRAGPGRGLHVLLWSSALTALAVGVAALAGVPTWGLLVAAGMCGATAGGLSAGFRTLLSRTVDHSMLLRAISVDAMLLEVTIIAGPALAVALGSGHWAAPMAGMAVAFVISSLMLPRAASGTVGVARAPSAGAAPIAWLRTVGWLGCLFTIGLLLSTLEVGALPLAERAWAGQGASALLIGVLSVSSIVGSALFAWRGGAGTAWAVLFLSVLAVGGGLTAFAAGRPALIAGLVLVGLCTGPLLAVSSVNLQRVLPPSRRSEGFSVAHFVQTVGFASGSLSLGILALETAIALGAGSAVACVVLVLSTRRHLGEEPDAGTAERSPG
ncbi:MFS transporter [Streptomyces lasiicapitis]|uniref:MFS transporter n=1 Tax=Streptomyces lasiicapitis TaxID=1923961 RepID=UPI0036587C48